ncbi:hypothetical protein R3P38DRAFT_3294216 [Favolaschia claudopus]|uniref:Uncharacterized protein n=1 Tax=Favolaschia claudopus TaxID=2862362 RepID=A0AAV9ZEC2_9AGAR
MRWRSLHLDEPVASSTRQLPPPLLPHPAPPRLRSPPRPVFSSSVSLQATSVYGVIKHPRPHLRRRCTQLQHCRGQPTPPFTDRIPAAARAGVKATSLPFPLQVPDPPLTPPRPLVPSSLGTPLAYAAQIPPLSPLPPSYFKCTALSPPDPLPFLVSRSTPPPMTLSISNLPALRRGVPLYTPLANLQMHSFRAGNSSGTSTTCASPRLPTHAHTHPRADASYTRLPRDGASPTARHITFDADADELTSSPPIPQAVCSRFSAETKTRHTDIATPPPALAPLSTYLDATRSTLSKFQSPRRRSNPRQVPPKPV